MRCSIPVSVGELFDKFSILKIKQVRITDPEKLAHVNREVELLSRVLAELPVSVPVVDKLIQEMVEVNQILWDIEDEIRAKEAAKDFDDAFVELARSVYLTNDMRYETKNKINRLFKSDLKEVKEYQPY